MKNKMETSKKILLFLMIVFIIVLIFSCYMIYKTDNLDPLSYLIPSIGGLLSVAVGFYYNKAKSENVLKISKSIKEEDLSKTFKNVANITNNDEIIDGIISELSNDGDNRNET